MVTYEASHGTSKKRADQIHANGFKIKHSSGRYGNGIYFWRKSHHYTNLAVGWFKFAKYKKRYHGESNPICTVIIVVLMAEEDEILDLEDDFFKDKLAKFAEAKGICGDNWDEISALVESFVQIIQKDLCIEFRIVLKKASPPPQKFCPEYPFWVLGWPDCCIVKDVTCIELKEIR